MFGGGGLALIIPRTTGCGLLKIGRLKPFCPKSRSEFFLGPSKKLAPFSKRQLLILACAASVHVPNAGAAGVVLVHRSPLRFACWLFSALRANLALIASKVEKLNGKPVTFRQRTTKPRQKKISPHSC